MYVSVVLMTESPFLQLNRLLIANFPMSSQTFFHYCFIISTYNFGYGMKHYMTLNGWTPV